MAKVDYGTLPPIPVRDANGRMTATRVGKVIDANLRTYAALVAAGVFLAPGTALPGYPALVLNDVRVDFPEKDDSSPRLIESYIEATDTFTQVGPDIIDSDLNGLQRVRRTLVAKAGTALPALVVGTTAGPSPTILANYSTEGSDTVVTRLSQVFLQPGVVSKSRGGGPASLPGTIRHSWQVWAMTAAECGIPGVVTDDREDNTQGFPVRTFTSLSSSGGGSPAGTLASYPTTLQITRHGTVQVATRSDAGGSTPYLVQVAPRSGRIAATVTIELTTTPAAPVPVAFNLDNLSVSVVALTRTQRYIGSDPSETIDGHVYSEQINIDQTTLAGYIFLSSGANGVEQTYTYASAVNADGDTIAGEAFESQIHRTITLSGSTTAPAASGLYSREVDPAFIALDGTTWYRVVTITI